MSKTIIEVESYIAVCLFAYYLASVEVIGSCYAVYSLARSYAVTVISEGHSPSALYSTSQLSARPSERRAVMISQRIAYVIIGYCSSLNRSKQISPRRRGIGQASARVRS